MRHPGAIPVPRRCPSFHCAALRQTSGCCRCLRCGALPGNRSSQTLGKYRCRIGLEFRDGPASAISTEEHGVRGEAGKVVFEPGLSIPVQTIEQCVNCLIVLLRSSAAVVPARQNSGSPDAEITATPEPGGRLRCGWLGPSWILVHGGLGILLVCWVDRDSLFFLGGRADHQGSVYVMLSLLCQQAGQDAGARGNPGLPDFDRGVVWTPFR